MSLENIRLPIIVIQNLFKNILIDVDEAGEKISVSERHSLNFLGDNIQHIVLLVDNPLEIYLNDRQLNILLGILNACKLNLSDIALLNVAEYPKLDYHEITNFLDARSVIMFGVLPSAIKLPFNIPWFQVQQFNKQIYLSVPSLNLLETNKELKRKLWASLKQIFSL